MDSSPAANHDHLQQDMVNFNPMELGYDCQSKLLHTKESYFLPVCDKPYHTNKENGQKGKRIEVLRTYAFRLGPNIFFYFCVHVLLVFYFHYNFSKQ